jgi:hypothetical protein
MVAAVIRILGRLCGFIGAIGSEMAGIDQVGIPGLQAEVPADWQRAGQWQSRSLMLQLGGDRYHCTSLG